MGFLCLAAGDRQDWNSMSLVGCVLAALGTFSVGPVILSWLLSTISDDTAAATATALAVCVGNIGGVTGPQIYSFFENKDDSYFWAHCIAAGHLVMLFCVAAVSVILRSKRLAGASQYRMCDSKETTALLATEEQVSFSNV